MSSSNTPSQPKKNLGRRKVKIQKMDNEKNLHVTFSKRHTGLFKKASEICTLTGADVGVVVFSPSDKSYSFGHPDIDNITKRFLQHNLTGVVASGSQQVQHIWIDPTNAEYLAQLEKQLEVEKAKRDSLKKWVPSPAALQSLSLQQLLALRGKVEEFGKALEAEKERAIPQEGVSVDGGMPIPSDDEIPIPYDHWATGYGEAGPDPK